jgi:hypothetical protein
LSAAVASVCLSVSLGAQAQSSTSATAPRQNSTTAPTPQQNSTTSTTPQQNPATAQETSGPGERVTLIGCVDRADQFNPTGSTVGATVSSQEFVLIKADEAGATASERRSTVGTSGSVGPMYRLQGKESDLNNQVGHKVELTGTRATSDAQNADAQAANATNPSWARAPRITVESIKMIAETCPR